jgi:TIGR02453 family protein
MGAFRGFTEQTILFLRDVRERNSKEWFERNRAVYERELLEPMRDLAADLSGTMLSIDPELETRPAVGKTISRIHRDTRFSRDKSLYRDAMWITFKRRSEDWKNGPAFFFELRTDGYRYGMGFYAASKDTMDKLRRWIDEEPEQFRKATAFFGRQRTFVIEGERYKRILDPSKPESVLQWYQRKNIYLACNREIDELLFSPRLADELAAGFQMLGGLYHAFLNLR